MLHLLGRSPFGLFVHSEHQPKERAGSRKEKERNAGSRKEENGRARTRLPTASTNQRSEKGRKKAGRAGRDRASALNARTCWAQL